MKFILFLFSLFTITSLNAQIAFTWQERNTISISDFKSPKTQINTDSVFYDLNAGSGISYSFNMDNAQYIKSKNLNSCVKNVFNTSLATLIAPNKETALRLVSFAQFQFNVNELYARKLRSLLINNIGDESTGELFSESYNTIKVDLLNHIDRVAAETQMGMDTVLLEEENKAVLQEIENLNEFCENCRTGLK